MSRIEELNSEVKHLSQGINSKDTKLKNQMRRNEELLADLEKINFQLH